jgi:hypothetical protein
LAVQRHEVARRAVLAWLVLGLVWASAVAAEAPREPTGPSASAPVRYVPDPRAVAIGEGFETAVPPTGWSSVATHAPNQTWYQFGGDFHSGASCAAVVWDDQVQQDEWLLTPPMTLNSGTLSFWSSGSLQWCRDAADNCDLEVWLVVGDVGGVDDIRVGNADPDWIAEFTWSQSVFVLDDQLPLEARIGFRYYGLNGAAINLDDVVLDGEATPVLIFADGFESGDTTEWQ